MNIQLNVKYHMMLDKEGYYPIFLFNVYVDELSKKLKTVVSGVLQMYI